MIDIMFQADFFQTFMNFLILGTIQGAIYALLAMGFSLVYGVGGVLNQAHGAFYVIAMYVFFLFFANFADRINLNIFDLGMISGIISALAIVTIIGGILYILLIKPLKQSHVGVVMVTFAFAFFIEQVIAVTVGTTYYDVPPIDAFWPISTWPPIRIFGVNILYHYFLVVIAAAVIITLVYLFITKSKIGKSIRAVAQDEEAASLMGINVDRILTYTVMVSAFLAGIAAVLYVPIDYVAPHIGWAVLMNSFSIVILGGLGSLPGGVVGAFIISYANSFTNFFISPVVSALIPIIVIVIMLLVRPRGIFGKKEID